MNVQIKVSPGNIWSGSKTLAVLTNPTELAKKRGNLKHSYPVRIAGRDFPDAEAAYQILKGEYDHFLSQSERCCVMREVIQAKFECHPHLAEFVEFNGGVKWLEKCDHWVRARRVSRRSMWEGQGRESLFIQCLIEGYELYMLDLKYGPVGDPAAKFNLGAE